jgi:hypothetical protein
MLEMPSGTGKTVTLLSLIISYMKVKHYCVAHQYNLTLFHVHFCMLYCITWKIQVFFL